MECEFCGKSHSKKGRPFTERTLRQHQRDAHRGREPGDPTFELTDMIADSDMPDGAYFAIAHEMGEW